MIRMITAVLAMPFVAASCLVGVSIATAAPPLSVTQDSLQPTVADAGQSIRAVLRIHSSECFTPDALTVSVTSADGTRMDYPGAATLPTICPSGYTLRTDVRSFPAGTYQQSGAYLYGGRWVYLPGTGLYVRP